MFTFFSMDPRNHHVNALPLMRSKLRPFCFSKRLPQPTVLCGSCGHVRLRKILVQFAKVCLCGFWNNVDFLQDVECIAYPFPKLVSQIIDLPGFASCSHHDKELLRTEKNRVKILCSPISVQPFRVACKVSNYPYTAKASLNLAPRNISVEPVVISPIR